MEKEINTRKTPCLAVFGTGSDVGKSIITTALCRILSNRGFRVAPFKAQNMSNNSGVTPEGLEMGRAQIVQAEAARIPPHVDMNPILLKPTGEKGSQLVLMGEAVENNSALEYHRKKEKLFALTCKALDRLKQRFDLIVLEGAGSCAEVNLMAEDIVNLRMAAYAEAPVILVGDIHRGGIFAQLVGTLACLPPENQEQIQGFIINRFRGDLRLFENGVSWIENKTGKTVFGVLPWHTGIQIDAEDSVVIENPIPVFPGETTQPAIAVIRIPHISNFTDIDALNRIDGLNVYFIEKVQDLSSFKAVILPGSKNTCYDLKWLKDSGWQNELLRYRTEGGHVLGICGGYQMLGNAVHDPDGLEGRPGSISGLSLLPVETVLKSPKTTTLTTFSWQGVHGSGYEIHMGWTELKSGEPVLKISDRNGKTCSDWDGCRSSDGLVMGTYMHGFFDTPEIAKQWLRQIGIDGLRVPNTGGAAARDEAYNRLAEHFESHIEFDAIINLAQ